MDNQNARKQSFESLDSQIFPTLSIESPVSIDTKEHNKGHQEENPQQQEETNEPQIEENNEIISINDNEDEDNKIDIPINEKPEAFQSTLVVADEYEFEPEVITINENDNENVGQIQPNIVIDLVDEQPIESVSEEQVQANEGNLERESAEEDVMEEEPKENNSIEMSNNGEMEIENDQNDQDQVKSVQEEEDSKPENKEEEVQEPVDITPNIVLQYFS